MALNNMANGKIKQEIVVIEDEELVEKSRSSEKIVCSSNSLSTEPRIPLSTGKIYFTPFERELVLSLAKPHLDIIENKETNAVISAKKADVFRKISKQFNDTACVIPRTEKQIRQCYYNIKKKLRKAPHIRQEQRKAGESQVLKKANLSSLEYQILTQPVLTLSLSSLYDSDTSVMDVSKSEDKSTSTADLVCSLSPSNSTSIEASEVMILDNSSSSIENCLDKEMPLNNQGLESETPEPASVSAEDKEMPFNNQGSESETHAPITLSVEDEEMPFNNQGLESETSEPASVSAEVSGVPTPQGNPLLQTLIMLRKNSKKESAPSAAARAAACIEAEHVQSTIYMQKEEKRKEQQALADRKEQELRMEHLREKIKLTRTKTLIHEKLLELMNSNPECINVLKNVLSEE